MAREKKKELESADTMDAAAEAFPPAFRLLDGVMDAWGAWRESHEARVGALRAYLGALAVAEVHRHDAPVAASGPAGASGAAHLESAPRGACNALPAERYALAVERTRYGARDALDGALAIEDRLEAERVVLRARVARRKAGEGDLAYFTRLADRGPINGELSLCDVDLAAVNLAAAVASEREAQTFLLDECAAIADRNLSGMRPIRRLEARIAAIEQQPFVGLLDPAELATRILVSESVYDRRAKEATATAAPPPPPAAARGRRRSRGAGRTGAT